MNTGHIKRAINGFSWEKSFANLDINDKVYLIKQLKVYFQFSYLIKLLHLTTETRLGFKHLINEKNAMYTNYLQNNKSNQSFETFQSFQSQLSSLIASWKNKYYSKVVKRLLDPSTNPRMYWSILKTFLNNKKIPVIPPIFHDNQYIKDFKQKAETLILTFLNNVRL